MHQGCRLAPTPQVLLAELKKAFTVDDIYQRARRALRYAVRHGCTAMRAHVEVDAYVGLRGVEALQQVQAECAGVLDLQLVAFAQKASFMTTLPRACCGKLFRWDCRYWVDVRIWMRTNTAISTGFSIPLRSLTLLDFHADSSDDPALLTCTYIAEQTIARGMQGRVVLGHLCTLDMLEAEHRARVIDLLQRAGLHVISLPATELHVKGRSPAPRTWRGVTRISELRAAGGERIDLDQQHREPFTPYGYPDLLRQALVAAMAAHLGNLEQLAWLLDLVTVNPARVLGLTDYGLSPGCRADLVVLDASSPEQAITEQVEKLWVLKAGRWWHAHAHLRGAGVAVRAERRAGSYCVQLPRQFGGGIVLILFACRHKQLGENLRRVALAAPEQRGPIHHADHANRYCPKGM